MQILWCWMIFCHSHLQYHQAAGVPLHWDCSRCGCAGRMKCNNWTRRELSWLNVSFTFHFHLQLQLQLHFIAFRLRPLRQHRHLRLAKHCTITSHVFWVHVVLFRHFNNNKLSSFSPFFLLLLLLVLYTLLYIHGRKF